MLDNFMILRGKEMCQLFKMPFISGLIFCTVKQKNFMDDQNTNKQDSTQQPERGNDNKEQPSKLDHIFNKENLQATEEDAAAEQQRKEAMTERD
jgi:hypothetical protein